MVGVDLCCEAMNDRDIDLQTAGIYKVVTPNVVANRILVCTCISRHLKGSHTSNQKMNAYLKPAVAGI